MSKICEFHHNGFKTRPIKLTGFTIKASKEELLLGVKIDSGLTFKEDITSTYSTTPYVNKDFQIHELTRALHSYEVVYHFTV